MLRNITSLAPCLITHFFSLSLRHRRLRNFFSLFIIFPSPLRMFARQVVVLSTPKEVLIAAAKGTRQRFEFTRRRWRAELETWRRDADGGQFVEKKFLSPAPIKTSICRRFLQLLIAIEKLLGRVRFCADRSKLFSRVYFAPCT